LHLPGVADQVQNTDIPELTRLFPLFLMQGKREKPILPAATGDQA